MLRPFFKPTRNGSLDGWKFSLDDDEGNVFLHGANPGDVQEHSPIHHPHLRLAETMIPYPTVDPGDTGKPFSFLSKRSKLNSRYGSSLLECGYHPWH